MGTAFCGNDPCESEATTVVDNVLALAECLEEWLNSSIPKQMPASVYLISATIKDGDHQYTGLALSEIPPSAEAVTAYFSYGDELTRIKTFSSELISPADVATLVRLNVAHYIGSADDEVGETEDADGG